MADILLIQPKLGLVDELRDNPSMPLGLVYLCSKIKYDVKIIDQRLEIDWKKTLKKELNKNPICVGISSIIGTQLINALKISRFVKQNSNVPVIMGGVLPSLSPIPVLNSKFVDFVIIGEGEKTFIELVNSIKSNRPLPKDGIAYRKNGFFYSKKQSNLINMNNINPRYELLELSRYVQKFKGYSFLPFQSSRGCVYECAFCYNPVFNHRKWRGMGPSNVRKNIKNLMRLNKVDGIYFVDDNFFCNINRGLEIAEIMRNLYLKWDIEGVDFNSVNAMTDSQLNSICKSGCIRMTLGIESGSDRVRKLIRKTPNIDTIIKVNKKLAKHNITIYYNFLSGFSGEKISEMFDTINLMKKVLRDNKNARVFPLNIYIPFDGTRLNIKKYSIYEQSKFDVHKVNIQTTKEAKIILNNYNFLSFFIDDKFNDYGIKGVMKKIIQFYRPLARYRFFNNKTSFMIEKTLSEILKEVL